MDKKKVLEYFTEYMEEATLGVGQPESLEYYVETASELENEGMIYIMIYYHELFSLLVFQIKCRLSVYLSE